MQVWMNLCAKFEITLQTQEVMMQSFMEMATVHHMISFGKNANSTFLVDSAFHMAVTQAPYSQYSVAHLRSLSSVSYRCIEFIDFEIFSCV